MAFLEIPNFSVFHLLNIKVEVIEIGYNLGDFGDFGFFQIFLTMEVADIGYC